MKTSETTDKIYPAFIKAQGEFGKAIKDSKNPFFKSDYADLNSYLRASSQGLQENGLAVLQDPSSGESNTITITTRIIHTSGQWIESEPLTMTPTDNKPQSIGSCETYCRRYSYSSFLGMGTGSKEDDDGNQASKKAPTLPKPDAEVLEKFLADIKTPEATQTAKNQFINKYTVSMLGQRTGRKKNKEIYDNIFTAKMDTFKEAE